MFSGYNVSDTQAVAADIYAHSPSQRPSIVENTGNRTVPAAQARAMDEINISRWRRQVCTSEEDSLTAYKEEKILIVIDQLDGT